MSFKHLIHAITANAANTTTTTTTTTTYITTNTVFDLNGYFSGVASGKARSQKLEHWKYLKQDCFHADMFLIAQSTASSSDG